MVTKAFLLKNGFKESVNNKDAPPWEGRYYVLRIHDLIWLAYDIETGFAELRRYMENKKKNPERLELSKYCRFCRKHVNHKEIKKSGS